MSFRPVNSDHAIELCQFAIGLSASVTGRVLVDLQRAHPHWMQHLPAISIGDAAEFEGEGIAFLLPSRIKQGLVSAFIRPDGAPVWAMRVYGNQIDLTCTRYTRWATVWEYAEAVLKPVLEVVEHAEPTLRIASLAHRMVDQFVAQPGYELDGLLVPGGILPSHFFGCGEQWHCHLGWFADGSNETELVNLDFNTSRQVLIKGPNETENRVGITVSHMQQHRFCRLPATPESLEGLPTLKEFDRVKGEMNNLHLKNKQLLVDLLQPSMLEVIGLRGGDAS